MDRAIEMVTAAGIRDHAFFFHNLARASRDLRLRLHLTICATVSEPFVHLSLPRRVVILKRHIKVIQSVVGNFVSLK